MEKATLFQEVLGTAFARLAPSMRQLHRGAPGEYRGRATVARGNGHLVNLLCNWGRLPRSVPDAPLRFQLEVSDGTETWTRFFSGSEPMVSQVQVAGGLLLERLGPAQLHFELSEREGVLHWRAMRLSVLGIPVPRRVFDFTARVSGEGVLYRFEIEARLVLVGLLIRYEGVLHVC